MMYSYLSTVCHVLQGVGSAQLGVHMYVAVTIALFCLFFTLAVFLCLRDLKSNCIYNQINTQFCFSLALIIYIAGSNSYGNSVRVLLSWVACRIAAAMNTTMVRVSWLNPTEPLAVREILGTGH